jgi:hypothetical protein
MNKEKLANAIDYLRQRRIYILEHDFKPTNEANTNVAVTIARYIAQNQPTEIRLRQVKRKTVTEDPSHLQLLFLVNAEGEK